MLFIKKLLKIFNLKEDIFEEMKKLIDPVDSIVQDAAMGYDEKNRDLIYEHKTFFHGERGFLVQVDGLIKANEQLAWYNDNGKFVKMGHLFSQCGPEVSEYYRKMMSLVEKEQYFLVKLFKPTLEEIRRHENASKAWSENLSHFSVLLDLIEADLKFADLLQKKLEEKGFLGFLKKPTEEELRNNRSIIANNVVVSIKNGNFTSATNWVNYEKNREWFSEEEIKFLNNLVASIENQDIDQFMQLIKNKNFEEIFNKEEVGFFENILGRLRKGTVTSDEATERLREEKKQLGTLNERTEGVEKEYKEVEETLAEIRAKAASLLSQVSRVRQDTNLDSLAEDSRALADLARSAGERAKKAEDTHEKIAEEELKKIVDNTARSNLALEVKPTEKISEKALALAKSLARIANQLKKLSKIKKRRRKGKTKPDDAEVIQEITAEAATEFNGVPKQLNDTAKSIQKTGVSVAHLKGLGGALIGSKDETITYVSKLAKKARRAVLILLAGLMLWQGYSQRRHIAQIPIRAVDAVHDVVNDARYPANYQKQLMALVGSGESFGTERAVKDMMTGALHDPTGFDTRADKCAAYVTMAVLNLFSLEENGIKSIHQLGTYGSAWNYSGNMTGKKATAFWESKGNEFVDFHKLKIGDVLGTYYSKSSYNRLGTVKAVLGRQLRSNKIDREEYDKQLENWQDNYSGFTHIILVLGERIQNFSYSNNPIREFSNQFGVNENHRDIIGSFQVEIGRKLYNLALEEDLLGYVDGFMGFTQLESGKKYRIVEKMGTHYFHGGSDQYAHIDPKDMAARTESLQHLFSKYRNGAEIFRVRLVLRPPQKTIRLHLNDPVYRDFGGIPDKITLADVNNPNQIQSLISRALRMSWSDASDLKRAFYELNPRFTNRKLDRNDVGQMVYVPTRNTKKGDVYPGSLAKSTNRVSKDTVVAYSASHMPSKRLIDNTYTAIEDAIKRRTPYGGKFSKRMKRHWAIKMAEVLGDKDYIYLRTVARRILQESNFTTEPTTPVGRKIPWLKKFGIGKVIVDDAIVPYWLNPSVGAAQVKLKTFQKLYQSKFGVNIGLKSIKEFLKTEKGAILAASWVLDKTIDHYGGKLDWRVANCFHYDYTHGLGASKVQALQASLQNLGYNLAKDGFWGPGTEKAAIEFLIHNGNSKKRAKEIVRACKGNIYRKGYSDDILVRELGKVYASLGSEAPIMNPDPFAKHNKVRLAGYRGEKARLT